MIVKSKKINNAGIIRMETKGEIKEVLIKEDIMNFDKAKINICYMSQSNSGIIELSKSEAENLCKTISSKIGLINSVKIIRD